MSLMKEIFKSIKLVESDVEKASSDAVDAVRADALDLNTHSQTSLSHEDIMQHINKAEEDEDSVETITFGLETDNDEIVKVYVAVNDADEFEKELAKLLGTEDTIEDALNELADKFDIVDVVWPEEDETADEEFGDDKDDDLKVDFDSSDSEDEELNKGAAEDKLKDELKKDDTKDMKKESSLALFRSILGEGVENTASLGDNALNQFHDEATSRYQQLVIEVLAGLGIPGNVVALKRSIFKRNLREVGKQLMHDSHLRIWLKRLADRLNMTDSSEKIGDSEEDIKENFEVDELARKSLQNKIARSIFDLASALGVPVEAIKARRSIVKREILDKAMEIAKDNQTKVALNMVIDALGIGTNPKMGIQINEPDKISEDVKLGTTSYSDAVGALLTAIGIPETNLNYQNAALRKAIDQKRISLQNPSVIARKMEILTKLINDSVKQPLGAPAPAPATSANESIHMHDLINGRVQLHEDEQPQENRLHMNSLIRGVALHEASEEPVNLGDWNFAMIGDTVVVGINDQTYKFDTSTADALLKALNDNSIVSVRAKDGARLSARPTKKTKGGKAGFVVKCQGCKDYPDGILMHQKDIKAFNDVVGV